MGGHARTFRFSIVPASELGPNATACWTHWSAALFDALRRHPSYSRKRSHADAVIPEIETRFEVNFPLFASPRLGYQRSKVELCDTWHGEAFLDLVARPAIDRLIGAHCTGSASGGSGGDGSGGGHRPQRLVLFPPIACHVAERVVMQWHHHEPCVSRVLTSGAEIGIYRRGRDVSFPPGALHLQKPQMAPELAAAAHATSSCAERRHFLAFDGATVRVKNQGDPIGMAYINRYRARLVPLHDPSRGVHIAVCAKRVLREAAGAREAMSKEAGGVAAAGNAALKAASDAGCGAYPRRLSETMNSSFVLVPRGDMPYAYRLLEALAFGAIPVVLADEYVLPFSEVVDWQEFSVHWPYARVSSLVPYLRTFRPERICAMRRRARQAWDGHFATADAQAHTLVRALAAQSGAAVKASRR